MNYTQQLIEALMDKGYPRLEAYIHLHYIYPFAVLHPFFYCTEETKKIMIERREK